MEEVRRESAAQNVFYVWTDVQFGAENSTTDVDEHNSSLLFFLHFAAEESVSALHRPKFCSVVKGNWILLALDVG